MCMQNAHVNDMPDSAGIQCGIIRRRVRSIQFCSHPDLGQTR
jgi:hypothetical protein